MLRSLDDIKRRLQIEVLWGDWLSCQTVKGMTINGLTHVQLLVFTL